VIYNSLDSWGWLDSVPAEVTSQMEIVSGDIRDPALMRELASGRDAILHLAALIAIPYSYRAPDLYVQTNVQGTLNLLNAARDEEVGRFVHTSTSEVYGTARFVPMDESHPLQGQSPYSATKIAADQMVNAFFTSFELPTITIRPFNTYGPRQSARAVIPTIVSQLASGKREVRLGALSPTRDFTYVPDTVSGFVRALEADSAFGETFNLGAGFEVSMQETFDAIAEVMGVDAVAVSTSERVRPERSEVERLFSNNSKAREMLGWSPDFAGVEGFKRGLAETAEWFRDPANLRRYRPDIYTV
jgi:NAD dependent epimerase/dehydratase